VTRRELAPWVLVALMTVIFAAVFIWLSLLRHQAYQSHAFDLGNMDQAAWNTIHGAPLRFTDMALPDGRVLTDRLAIHVEPLLVPISLLYLVHGGPETLLVLQPLVVATGAVPAYLLARRASLGPWQSLVFPAAYLLHPSLQNALLDDFHAVTLSAALLLWAMYYLVVDSLWAFAAFAVLAAATKEEVALLVALLGAALFLRRRVAGACTFVGGVLWFLIAVSVIIPHFNPGGHSPYLARYAYLGHGLRGALVGLATKPGVVWHTLTSPPRLLYLDAILDPAGFVPALGLPVLLLALPTFAINMLSDDPTMYSGFYQYSAEVVPYVTVAAIAGVRAASFWSDRHLVLGARLVSPVLTGLVLVAAVAAGWIYGFTPLSQGYAVPSAGLHQALESRILRTIPRNAVVAAADEIEPHMSDRKTVYLLPTVHPRNGPSAQYIALDASIPSQPVTPRVLRGVASRALSDRYGVVAARDGVLLLKRGARRSRLPAPFFSFIYAGMPRQRLRGLHWGPLSLVGITVHPSYGWVNRARPAVEVETYWRTRAPLSDRVRIEFATSPLYTARPVPAGFRPAPAGRARGSWAYESDSPTWDWLPLRGWPVHRTIHVASLPVTLAGAEVGKADVAVDVSGLGPARGVPASRSVAGSSTMVRLTTVDVRR
jgi:uncharacterized membrane protein